LDGESIVANVSASVMDCLVLGQPKIYIQIGTVMTETGYRNQGLSRYLVEKIIEEWKNNCDMIYLFANDSVLSFYPKFGFITANEYMHSKTVETGNQVMAAEKLDMSLDSNIKLVEKKVLNSVSLSKLTVRNNVGLIMFYCTSFMSDNIYYIRELDTIVISEIHGDTLYLQEVFSSSEVDLETIIKSLVNKEVRKVVLGFTPKDDKSYDINLLQQDNTTLFILNCREELFINNKIRFPELSHA
jgi:hypothetical protein